MSRLALVFGALIAMVGGVGYAATRFWHAMIPVVLGGLMMVCGAVAHTDEVKRRMIAMHIAATVGLLGFLGTIPGVVAMIRYLEGGQPGTLGGVAVGHRAAAEVQSSTCLLCLLFVLLCIRSFIAARRQRA
jgi:cytochrome bd-type quinol oxidase subunit 1